MYELETITRATLAAARGQSFEVLHDTNSKEFNAVWQIYLEKVKLRNGNFVHHWAMTAAPLTAKNQRVVFPYHKIAYATRLVTTAYVSCGYHTATLFADLQPEYSPKAVLVATHIEEKVRGIIDLVQRMDEYIEALSHKPDDKTVDALHEFYSVALVALHETRRVASGVLGKEFDATMVRCEHQLSCYGRNSIIPRMLDRQIKQTRRLREQAASGYAHQEQQQWQTMMGRPAPVMTDVPPIEDPKVVVLDDAMRRRLKERAKQRAASPNKDKPET